MLALQNINSQDFMMPPVDSPWNDIWHHAAREICFNKSEAPPT